MSIRKKLTRAVALIMLLTLMVSTQVFAVETTGSAAISTAPRLSGYRCRDSSCASYLEFEYSLGPTAKCEYCNAILSAYSCPACNKWYAFCTNGHYNFTPGR